MTPPAAGTVAVTAGAGFLGSALCRRLLDDGVDVVCLDRADRLARAELPPGLRTVAYDLGDGRSAATALAGAVAVVHLAHRGLPKPLGSPEAEEDVAANVRGAQLLVEDCVAVGVGRVVFASSGGTVYGAPDRLPVTEATPLAPISAYGVAKVAVEERLVASAAGTGVDVVSLRIGNAVGPGQLRGAGVGAPARFLSLVAAGRPVVVWGDGGVVRDYVWVDDVVDAVLAALDPGTPPTAYNVGTGVGTSLHDLLDLVVEVTGRELEVVHESGREFDVPSIVLDSTLLRTTTGWAPRTSLREGLEIVWRAALSGR